MAEVLLALDQGTTSSRAIVFDRSGHVLGIHHVPLTQRYPQRRRAGLPILEMMSCEPESTTSRELVQ